MRIRPNFRPHPRRLILTRDQHDIGAVIFQRRDLVVAPHDVHRFDAFFPGEPDDMQPDG